jgi:hypothetical protein
MSTEEIARKSDQLASLQSIGEAGINYYFVCYTYHIIKVVIFVTLSGFSFSRKMVLLVL